MRLYVIFDSVAEKCSPVFEQSNDVSAMRAAIEVMKSTPNPEDFILRWCGYISFDGRIDTAGCVDVCKLSEVEDSYRMKTGKRPLPTEELKRRLEEPPVGGDFSNEKELDEND